MKLMQIDHNTALSDLLATHAMTDTSRTQQRPHVVSIIADEGCLDPAQVESHTSAARLDSWHACQLCIRTWTLSMLMIIHRSLYALPTL